MCVCVYVRRRTPVAALASQAFSVKTKQLNLEIQDVGPFCRLLRKKKKGGGERVPNLIHHFEMTEKNKSKIYISAKTTFIMFWRQSLKVLLAHRSCSLI